ncbi:hypothetical protein [Halostella sp. PRR32]|uniref:DUF7096 domain-containing protein n=1 Tax=Halostella sp. PRR32 TaxID=3098147 RepID=UPI002B1DE697|nr:hypothetical protein [Halostella sp. PRR32]
MKRLTTVALVLLLAVPGQVAGVPPTDTAPPEEQVVGPDDRPAVETLSQDENEAGNTTSRLNPSGNVVSSHVSSETDMSQVLTEADNRMELRFRNRTFQRQFSKASSAASRSAVASAMLDDIERRTEQLKSEERSAVRAYVNGSISESDLLRTLASVHTRSQTLDDTLTNHEQLESSLLDYSESDRRSTIADELEMLRSPVRQRLDQVYDGSADQRSTVTYVVASSNGVVVESIADGEYLREAVRFDNTNANTTDTFDGDTSALHEYTQTELYPWSFSNNPSISFGGISESRYRLSIGHSQGTVSAYIDGNTREVFRESQRLRLVELPHSGSLTTTKDGLNLTINKTPNNGPMRFNLTTTDGDPVNGVVEINGKEVGRTGTDGVLWTLQPRSYYLISVSTETTTINATVSS